VPVSRETVLHIAKLAHIGLSEEEINQMTEQLSSVIDHVARLQEVDTEEIPPTAHALPVENVMREDVLAASWTPDEALANAPHRYDNLFEVQAIFD
jgi:aspartyl-tRNA(Asn)/glutamyl-tRNA(Gln) amidotransferase subunit C